MKNRTREHDRLVESATDQAIKLGEGLEDPEADLIVRDMGRDGLASGPEGHQR